MKINDVKHNHSLTDLLKVLIFSILMLLPFINVGVRCGYVMFNKNAYQSYSGQVESEIQYYDELPPLNEKIYSYLNPLTEFYNTGYLPVRNFEYIDTNLSIYEDTTQVAYIRLYANKAFYLWDSNYAQLKAYQITGTNYCNFSYELLAYNNDINQVGTMFSYYDENSYNYIDNVFEYSVSQLEQNQLYNWTTQTALYTGVSTMTTQLGITGILIPMLVCYWFFITIIYIILDIVIKLFTMLTHAIGSKKA